MPHNTIYAPSHEEYVRKGSNQNLRDLKMRMCVRLSTGMPMPHPHTLWPQMSEHALAPPHVFDAADSGPKLAEREARPHMDHAAPH